jgi:comEA protein
MRTGFLCRLFTTKEQFILIGVGFALCAGCIVLYATHSPLPPEDTPLDSVDAPDMTANPALPLLPTAPELPEVEATIELPPPPSEPAKPIAVAIVGAVAAPGVYTLAADARVKDLIKAAGGLLEDADVSDINMVAQLLDGSTLTIAAGAHAAVEGDRLVMRGASRQPAVNPRQYTISGFGYDRAESTMPQTSGVRPGAGGATGAAMQGGLIDINRATLEELDTLPGIGPVKAQSIINYRSQQPFRSVDELESVDGIGAKTLENIRPLVTVGAS